MTDKGMIGGSSTILILSLLQKREMYGYEIVQELAAQSDDTFRLQEGTLYPLLHSLESAGHIVSRVQVCGGRPRRYYRITESGQTLLAERLRQWNTITGMLRRLNSDPPVAESV